MIFPPLTPPFRSKEILRFKMRAERKAAAAARPDAARHAARIFLENIPLPEGTTIALYHPIKEELDTLPLFEALAARGYAIALPVSFKKRQPLTFRAHQDGDPLSPGRYGVMTPGENAAEVKPQIIVTPLLAFTRKGYRLGYGGGYYDRTLATMRANGDVLAVGFGFAAQEVDKMPSTAHDARLDWIVTEREAIET